MTEFLLLVIAVGIGVLIFRKPGSQIELPVRMERVRASKIVPLVSPEPPISHVSQVLPVSQQIATPAVAPTVKPTAPPPGKVGAVMLMLMALLYLISPVDAVPDIFPVLGWLDDLGVLSYASKNLSKAFKPPVIQA